MPVTNSMDADGKIIDVRNDSSALPSPPDNTGKTAVSDQPQLADRRSNWMDDWERDPVTGLSRPRSTGLPRR